MNTKRKADLQRRLSMASVPKPPQGLADRIKADIPDLRAVPRERERAPRSFMFNVRVAASIILLAGSAYLTLNLLSRSKTSNVAMPPVTAAARVADATTTAAKLPQAMRPMIEQPVTVSTDTSQPAVDRYTYADAEPIRPVLRARTRPEQQVADAAPASPIPAYPPPPAVAEPAPVMPAPAPALVISAQAPRVERDPSAMESRNAAAPQRATSGSAVGGVMGGLVGGVANSIGAPAAKAADINLAAKEEVFGISTDPNAFSRVKDAIEHGERPHNVDVEALVNYFAGLPRRSPREVSLDVEASPAPLNAGPHAFIIRTTIDTARAELAAGSSVPPVATDAQLEIELNPDAVVSHHRVGNDSASPVVEHTLLKNVSATALYAVELRPNLGWRQNVATVRLRYRSVESGEQRTLTRVVRASDFAHTWPAASRRHRLASLGAVWGETLRNAPGANDVAMRAEELANQEPKDSKARELATLASASSRLQSSGSTGSGR